MDNRDRVASFMKPENHELQENELVCDKCNGTGCIPSEFSPSELASRCPKCQGDGWVDWISNITGKPIRYMYGSSSMSSGTSGTDIICDQMAKEISDQIDKDILETIITQAEQKVNHKEVFL